MSKASNEIIEIAKGQEETTDLKLASIPEVPKAPLTMQQVIKYNLIPAPVKSSDSRAIKYMEQSGTDSVWELDAIPPKILDKIIEKSILQSDLGITPVSDNKIIRLIVPPLSEERRNELVKIVKKVSEEGKVFTIDSLKF